MKPIWHELASFHRNSFRLIYVAQPGSEQLEHHLLSKPSDELHEQSSFIYEACF